MHATAAGDPPAFDAANLHTGSAAQAGDRLVGVWAADARFAGTQVAGLDRAGRFAGHVNVARTAYLGHSFGGAASLEACPTDPHCAGAIDLDGTQYGPVVRTGLGKPMMIVASQGSCVTGTCQPADTPNRADRATARALLAASTGQAWCYQINGSRHFNFSEPNEHATTEGRSGLTDITDIAASLIGVTATTAWGIGIRIARAQGRPTAGDPSRPRSLFSVHDRSTQVDLRDGRRADDGRLFDPGRRTTGIGPEGVQYFPRTADHRGSLGFLP